MGGSDGKVRAYNNVSNSLILNQTITLGFVIFDLKLSNDKIVVTGTSTSLWFYQNNGSAFELEQTFPTMNTNVGRMDISDNFSTMAFGRDSDTLNIITRNNNSYELSDTQLIGDIITRVSADQSFQYFWYRRGWVWPYSISVLLNALPAISPTTVQTVLMVIN